MKQSETFSPTFFEILKKKEETYFWFSVRRKWIYDSIRRFIHPPAKVLEVGCGTGNVASYLARMGYDVTGAEYFDEAAGFSWPGFERVRADAGSLPFEDNTFDVVGLFDVIEHLEDDIAPLKEAHRVLKRGGAAVITVPAGEELWSRVDEMSYHQRRYGKQGLKESLSAAGFEVLRMDFIFMTLYLPMRFLRRKEIDITEMFRINRVVNSLLRGIFEIERMISRMVSLPVGTSLIALARKN